MAYDHADIEKKAHEKWSALDLYRADLADETKEPYYLLVEFPYPSGDLHIGHWYAFSVTDIYARLLRARGKNVLFPIGFDAFGLPAENAAIKHGVDPKEWTYKNIERMRSQLASMGASFDWSKEVVACDPSYYQWTQWLFTKLFEHGLAEHREAAVKWCPKDQTVLANEQVIDGCCERCGTDVVEKRLTQWFFKITQYAERLLAGLDALPWREEIKEAQRAWIGKSEGAYLYFPIFGREEKIKVFTTRVDTVYGATYVVLAPEHPLVSSLLTAVSNKKEVEAYVKTTETKSERERSENKEKTGVKMEGVSAINPATKEEIPIYVADYVLGSYGTGAVMAVPAHDERDYEFAQKMRLPVKQVVERLFVCTEGADAIRPDEPFEKRAAVACVIKHWNEDKFLCVRWKSVPWRGFVTGGLDDEPIDVAGIREIQEETGFKNVRFVKKLGDSISVQFYHVNKKVNRWAQFQGAYLELIDGERGEIPEEEKAIHDLEWVSREEVAEFITAPDIKFIWQQFINGDTPYTGPGVLTNSGEFSGRDNHEVLTDIITAAGGEKATMYRLRDWLISRQRYWGCPIPIVYDPEGKPHVVPAEHLPWLLPTDVDFTPTGSTTLTTGEPKSPLASSVELKERVTKIFGEEWTPEYDTLDTFVDSSWYFLRYLDSKDAHKFSDASVMKKWLPINRYSGGSEHTTMHVLYARFFMKALYDLALVPVEEPFNERFNRGLIMGPDGQKMSKSKGNVINPDEFVQKYGADAVRVYLAFIGPYNETGSYPWNLDGVAAMQKFLDRIVRLVEKHLAVRPPSEVPGAIQQMLARASTKIVEDGDRFKFNTGVAALMTLLNDLERAPEVPQSALKDLIVMLAPFAPHLAEHLWETLGGEGSVHQQSWPSVALEAATTAEIVVQINGKRRGSITLDRDSTQEEVLAVARGISMVATALGTGEPKRVIYVPGKILNLVV